MTDNMKDKSNSTYDKVCKMRAERLARTLFPLILTVYFPMLSIVLIVFFMAKPFKFALLVSAVFLCIFIFLGTKLFKSDYEIAKRREDEFLKSQEKMLDNFKSFKNGR